MIRTAVFVAVILAAVHAPAEEKPLRVYFVGNSVTDTINYRALAELAKSRGHKHVWGRHMIPGAAAPMDLAASEGWFSRTALRPLSQRPGQLPVGCSQPSAIRPPPGRQGRRYGHGEELH